MNDPTPSSRIEQLRIAQFLATWIFIAIAFIWVLDVGSRFFVPLVLAIFAAILVETLTRFWMRLPLGKVRIPRWLAGILSVIAILLLMYKFAAVVVDNAGRIQTDAPEYERNLDSLYENTMVWVDDTFKLEQEDHKALDEWVEKIDLRALANMLMNTLLSLVGDFTLVITYLYFLILERKFIRPKIIALFPNKKRQGLVTNLVEDIQRDMRIYIGMKTLVSLLTAVLSLIVLWWVGVRYAEFWALLIFVCNFIPTVGSIFATALPATLTLVQFEEPLGPFLIVAGGIWSMQLFVSNIVEPALMGKTLNMSTFVVILSLVFWGMLWGLTGMFLCIPLTVIILMIAARFRATRWMAVLLSKEGSVEVEPIDFGELAEDEG